MIGKRSRADSYHSGIRPEAAALHHLQILRRRRDWKQRAEDASPKGRERPSVARDWLVETLSARGFAFSTEKQASAVGATLTSVNRMSAMMHEAGVIEVADRGGMMNVWTIRPPPHSVAMRDDSVAELKLAPPLTKDSGLASINTLA